MHVSLQHSSRNSSYKWFSLLELVIILIIIGLLMTAASRLFQMPRQYILESERCVALVDGYVRQFFYHAVSGKSLFISGASISPESYSLVFQSGGGHFQIIGWYSPQSGTLTATTTLSPVTASSYPLPGCLGSAHSLRIAWSIGTASDVNLRIDIRKNLQQDGLALPMTICESDDDQQCRGGYFATGLISYSICQTSSTGCISETLFATQLFDTRTQTIKSKKCLSLPADGSCRRRSTDEF